MPRGRRKVVKKKSFGKNISVALAKGGAATALGGIAGGTEVLAGETAANYTKLGMGVAGVLSEMYIDREKNPVVKSIGDAALHGPAFSTGEKYAKKGVSHLIEASREKRRAEDLETLRADLRADQELDEPAEYPEQRTAHQKKNGVVVVPAARAPVADAPQPQPPVQE